MGNLVDAVIDLACAVQQIPAPPFGESQRAKYILERFRGEGLSDVHIDKEGNAYARIPGRSQSPPLIVSAHLDTVFPRHTTLSLRRDKDRIYGPGIGDNSLGVAGLFGLYWGLKQQGFANHELPGDIWLVANVGEEGVGDLRGMRAIVDRFAGHALAYVVIEGMSLGFVYHRGLGVRRYLIEIHTQGGHSWVDYGAPSAVHELGRLIAALDKLELPADPRTSLNVGVVSGGTSVNTIAPHAKMELDLRSESSDVLSKVIGKVETIVQSFDREGVQTGMEIIGDRPAGGLPAEHPVLQLALQTLEAQGLEPHLITGSTDANIPLSRGFPAVCLGLTTGGGAHTIEEYIEIPPLEKGLAALLSFVPQVFQLPLSSP